MINFKHKKRLFAPGQNGSKYYRIPSLLQTKQGRLLAVCDRRLDYQEDWGRIHLSLRKSDDNGKTWSNDEVIVKTFEAEKESSFVIDACMVEDEVHEKIHLFVDMFPHSKGFFSAEKLKDAMIYNENNHLRLWSGEEKYWLSDEGYILDNQGKKTNWTVDLSNNPETWGTLFYKNEKKGNILVSNDFFVADPTVHIWHFSSSDQGDTWFFEGDITSQVRENWMYFLGVAPGVGLQLSSGRLCIPVYYTNENLGYSQSSAIIYSDDFGKTWRRSSSPNDARLDSRVMKDLDKITTESQLVLHNNRLLMFMRNYTGKVQYAESFDNGETWSEPQSIDVTEPYCQLSVVSDDEYIYISNPSGPGRVNGRLTALKDLKPVYSQVFHSGVFEYSCLAYDHKNKHLHIFYETKDDGEKMSLYYIQCDLNQLKEEAL